MKTYTVTGGTRYRGRANGETFSAELTEEEEARAIARGSIKLADETGDTPVDSVEDKNTNPESLDLGNGDEEPAPFAPFDGDGGKE